MAQTLSMNSLLVQTTNHTVFEEEEAEEKQPKEKQRTLSRHYCVVVARCVGIVSKMTKKEDKSNSANPTVSEDVSYL